MPTACPQCSASLPSDPAAGCPGCGWKPAPESPTVTHVPEPSAASETLTAPYAEAPPSDEHILAALMRRLPDYRDWAPVGRGGMGMVWSAFHPVLSRKVAVKVILPALAEREGFAERFEREARVMADLDHPGIVRVYDFGTAEGVYFIVMEYVPLNLRQYRRLWQPDAPDTAPATPDMAAAAARQFRELCEALHYAHQRGYLHRDIKPENILVTDKDPVTGWRRFKLADFGLARLSGAGLQMGDGSGTPAYMASEQRWGGEDRSSDVYSLGVVLYEYLTGVRPQLAEVACVFFDKSGRIRSEYREFMAKFPAATHQQLPSELGLDARFDRIVHKATLPLESNNRYRTARQMASDLEDVEKRSAYSDLGTALLLMGATGYTTGDMFFKSLSGHFSSYHSMTVISSVIWATSLCLLNTFTRLRRLWSGCFWAAVLATAVLGPLTGGERKISDNDRYIIETLAILFTWLVTLGVGLAMSVRMRVDTFREVLFGGSTIREWLWGKHWVVSSLICGGCLVLLYAAPLALEQWGPAILTAYLALIWILWETVPLKE